MNRNRLTQEEQDFVRGTAQPQNENQEPRAFIDISDTVGNWRKGDIVEENTGEYCEGRDPIDLENFAPDDEVFMQTGSHNCVKKENLRQSVRNGRNPLTNENLTRQELDFINEEGPDVEYIISAEDLSDESGDENEINETRFLGIAMVIREVQPLPDQQKFRIRVYRRDVLSHRDGLLFERTFTPAENRMLHRERIYSVVERELDPTQSIFQITANDITVDSDCCVYEYDRYTLFPEMYRTTLPDTGEVVNEIRVMAYINNSQKIKIIPMWQQYQQQLEPQGYNADMNVLEAPVLSIEHVFVYLMGQEPRSWVQQQTSSYRQNQILLLIFEEYYRQWAFLPVNGLFHYRYNTVESAIAQMIDPDNEALQSFIDRTSDFYVRVHIKDRNIYDLNVPVNLVLQAGQRFTMDDDRICLTFTDRDWQPILVEQ